MKIDLLSLTQTVLIVPGNTGTIYTNQVGGTECDHPELEGSIIPIEYDIPLDKPEESLTSNLFRIFPEGNPGLIDKTLAKKIEELLKNSPFTRDVEINWDKLEFSKESWVHVKIVGTLDDAIETDKVCEAILTWPNSD